MVEISCYHKFFHSLHSSIYISYLGTCDLLPSASDIVPKTVHRLTSDFQANQHLCWIRMVPFPISLYLYFLNLDFLPMNARLRIIQSNFTGQLPRYFKESSVNSSRNTHLIPEGMNNLNLPDPLSIYNGHCDVLVYLNAKDSDICTRFMVGSSNPGIRKSFFFFLSSVKWSFYCYKKTW
jgi:hypothetical protein